MAPNLVEHVVADAGAFLKRAPLQEFGRNIYTLREVLDEIRDRPTRRSLAVLPYHLTLREPNPEHIRTEMLLTRRFLLDPVRYLDLIMDHDGVLQEDGRLSQPVGHRHQGSGSDLPAAAGARRVADPQDGTGPEGTGPDPSEPVRPAQIPDPPLSQVTIQSTQRHPEAPVHIAGFHLPSRVRTQAGSGSGSLSPSLQRTVDVGDAGPAGSEPSPQTDLDQFNSFQFWRQPVASLRGDELDLLVGGGSADTAPVPTVLTGSVPTGPVRRPDTPPSSEPDQDFSSFRFWRDPVPSLDPELLGLLDVGGASSPERRAGPEPAEDQSDEEDGWITPSNIRQVKMESSDWTEAADVRVGCLTTDFAMQNVLIQMGLHVLSLGGLVIRRAQSYILRCHGCFRTTSNMSKAFCPHCGNQTLKKLAVTVGDDGSIQMHFSKNPKVMNPRGTRYSLPLPRGGKHGADPQLAEDQRVPQQRLSRKARQKTDALDPDYLAAAAPFCQNDVYSRAANLQIRDAQSGAGRRRANPNAARRKFLRKK